MCFCSWENHRTKWANLQQTMCDYQRVVWVCHGLSENWGYPRIDLPSSSLLIWTCLGIPIFRQTHISWFYVIYIYSHIELQIYMVVEFLATTLLLTPNTTVLTYRWHKYVYIYTYIYIWYIYIWTIWYILYTYYIIYVYYIYLFVFIYIYISI